jgi:hypothetical protein
MIKFHDEKFMLVKVVENECIPEWLYLLQEPNGP